MTNCPASVRGKNETPTSGKSKKLRQKTPNKSQDDLLGVIESLFDPTVVSVEHALEAID